MTREEAIMYWEDFLGEIDQMEVDDCWTNEDAETQREAAKMAISALRQQEHFREANKLLTMDELSERNAPVFLPIKDFPNGGYWCLCENGYIIPPSGHGFMAKERPNWVFYSQKPEEDEHA